jgi:two-component system sensor histidine kinase UhpB
VFGYSREQLAQRMIEDLLPETLRHSHAALRAGYFEQPVRRPMGSGRQLFARRADGAVFPVDVMLSPLSPPDAGDKLVIATVRDITGQRHNEEALRESEKRFRNTLEHAPIGMSLVSPDGRWLEVNNALCEMVGYSKADMLRMRIQDITHPDDLPKDLALARQLLDGGIRFYQLEKRYIRRDGSLVTVLLTRSLLRAAALHRPDRELSIHRRSRSIAR